MHVFTGGFEILKCHLSSRTVFQTFRKDTEIIFPYRAQEFVPERDLGVDISRLDARIRVYEYVFAAFGFGGARNAVLRRA